jgi:hypothetical protein
MNFIGRATDATVMGFRTAARTYTTVLRLSNIILKNLITMFVRQPCGRCKTNAKHYDLETSKNRESLLRLSQDCLETSKICQKIAEIMCMLRKQFATLQQPCDLKNSYDYLAVVRACACVRVRVRA